MERLWQYGPSWAALTLGDQGCVVRDARGLWRFPAHQIDVVDTTGAGDAFHGGAIYGLLHRWDMEHTIRFAAAVAALNCRRLGGRTALPNLPEVARFLASRPPLALQPLA